MIEIILATVCVTLLGVIILDNVNQYYQEKRWREERAELLDRLMARDYDQYAHITIEKAQAEGDGKRKMEVVSVEDLEKKLEERQETGVAI